MNDIHAVTRRHIFRRVFMNQVRTFEDIYPSTAPGALLNSEAPEALKRVIDEAGVDSWN